VRLRSSYVHSPDVDAKQEGLRQLLASHRDRLEHVWQRGQDADHLKETDAVPKGRKYPGETPVAVRTHACPGAPTFALSRGPELHFSQQDKNARVHFYR